MDGVFSTQLHFFYSAQLLTLSSLVSLHLPVPMREDHKEVPVFLFELSKYEVSR